MLQECDWLLWPQASSEELPGSNLRVRSFAPVPQGFEQFDQVPQPDQWHTGGHDIPVHGFSSRVVPLPYVGIALQLRPP